MTLKFRRAALATLLSATVVATGIQAPAANARFILTTTTEGNSTSFRISRENSDTKLMNDWLNAVGSIQNTVAQEVMNRIPDVRARFDFANAANLQFRKTVRKETLTSEEETQLANARAGATPALKALGFSDAEIELLYLRGYPLVDEAWKIINDYTEFNSDLLDPPRPVSYMGRNDGRLQWLLCNKNEVANFMRAPFDRLAENHTQIFKDVVSHANAAPARLADQMIANMGPEEMYRIAKEHYEARYRAMGMTAPAYPVDEAKCYSNPVQPTTSTLAPAITTTSNRPSNPTTSTTTSTTTPNRVTSDPYVAPVTTTTATTTSARVTDPYLPPTIPSVTVTTTAPGTTVTIIRPGGEEVYASMPAETVTSTTSVVPQPAAGSSGSWIWAVIAAILGIGGLVAAFFNFQNNQR